MFKSITIAALLASVSTGAIADNASNHATAHDILKNLIEIDTSNAKAHKAVDHLANRFEKAGFDVVRKMNFGTKQGLYVRWKAKNPTKKPIAMIGHLDVVPAKREDWTLPPFELIEDEKFFYGRGTADNKSGITHVSATLLRLKAEGFEPNRDLIAYFSGDEETGMDTTRNFLRDHRDMMDVDFVLNSDAGGGTIMNETGFSYGIQASEKVFVSFKVQIRNTGGHSSRPRKDNAIYELATALKKIEVYAFPLNMNEITAGYFRETAKLKKGQEKKDLNALASGKANKKIIARLSGNVAYNATMRTTCVATQLFGGHAENALPQLAEATIQCRMMPGVEAENVRQTLIKVIGDKNAAVMQMAPEKPSPASPLRDDVMNAVKKQVHKRYPGIPVMPNMSTGGTDGLFYRNINIPVYGVGALFSAQGEANAHGQNEKIRVKEFYDGLNHWHGLITDLASN
ncbi:MAG: M20/M25/M40 family metallo-hydrolase [Sphingomonadales bacterium]|nr:M20/M25/M40 family metallo-hydrolase [Sphingomonadales bacterium]